MYTAVGQLPVDMSALTKSFVDPAVAQLKARMPELMNAAAPAAVEALKKNGPQIIGAVAPALESYVTTRFYPQIVKPIVEKELSRVQSAGVKTARIAGVAAGGAALLAVVAILVSRRRKGQPQ